MTRTTKLILTVSGIIALLVVGVIVAGIIFVVHFESGESRRGYEAKNIEGRDSGKKTDQIGCMNEGLARAKGMNAVWAVWLTTRHSSRSV